METLNELMYGQDYTAKLAWGGLEPSPTFKSLNNKDAISRIIRNEKEANRAAKGKKCK